MILTKQDCQEIYELAQLREAAAKMSDNTGARYCFALY
jgi:hypothetical protein